MEGLGQLDRAPAGDRSSASLRDWQPMMATVSVPPYNAVKQNSVSLKQGLANEQEQPLPGGAAMWMFSKRAHRWGLCRSTLDGGQLVETPIIYQESPAWLALPWAAAGSGTASVCLAFFFGGCLGLGGRSTLFIGPFRWSVSLGAARAFFEMGISDESLIGSGFPLPVTPGRSCC